MILMVLSSSSVSWLCWEIVFSLLASGGGVVVFWGLWTEKKAIKEWYRDVVDLRSSKLRAERGWEILMWGIGLEVLLAIAFAMKGGWELRQLALSEAKNDRLKQPITSIVADVYLFISGTNFIENSVEVFPALYYLTIN